MAPVLEHRNYRLRLRTQPIKPESRKQYQGCSLEFRWALLGRLWFFYSIIYHNKYRHYLLDSQSSCHPAMYQRLTLSYKLPTSDNAQSLLRHCLRFLLKRASMLHNQLLQLQMVCSQHLIHLCLVLVQEERRSIILKLKKGNLSEM